MRQQMKGVRGMNLPEFLRAVDAATARITPEQLADFIHQQARQLPAERRERYLGELRSRVSGKATETPAAPDNTELLNRLRLIAEGELCLRSEYNEEYDDWNGDDEDEFLIEDPHDIADTVSRSMEAAHQYVASGAYEEGLRLGQTLLNLNITVEGDYTDYSDEPFGIGDLADYDMVPDYDALLRRLYVDMLVAVYFLRSGDGRCAELYTLFEWYGEEDGLNLEQVMKGSSRELPDFPAFLPQWTDYLGGKTGTTADRLIAEAVALSGDPETRKSAASRFANTHPGLYERLLRGNPDGMEDRQLLSIGQEALREIRPDIRLRSNIALLTAACALRLDDRDEAERCWLEALRSEPNATNYLRLCVESRDIPRSQEAAHAICGTYHAGGKLPGVFSSYDKSENAVFQVSDSMRCSLAFLEQDFLFVKVRGMSVNAGLGWSSTFVNQGLALFLLYLYQGEKLDKGTEWMCVLAIAAMEFDADRYCESLLRDTEEDKLQVFWDVFRAWRKSHLCAEAKQADLLREMERLVDLRLEGIMSANRRNYYDECAAYVAALAEVKASRGEVSGKQEVLRAYKDRYSRRRAFHQELRNFGMK